jgi:hypothetical protein
MWMMGVPLSWPSFVPVDNHPVIFKTSQTELTLKRKSNSICYHAVRESDAMGKMLKRHIPSKLKLADRLNKVLFGSLHKALVCRVL